MSYEGILLKETFATQNSLTLLLLVQFFLFAFSFPALAKRAIMLFKSVSGALDLSHQTAVFTGKEVTQLVGAFLFSGINFSLVLYILFMPNESLVWDKFGLVVACVFTLLALKYLVFRFLGYVFFSRELTLFWFQNYLAVLLLFGALLFPALLVMVYARANEPVLLWSTVVAAILYLALLIYRLLAIFTIRISSFIYIILYLCALEIEPIILLCFLLTTRQIFIN